MTAVPSSATVCPIPIPVSTAIRASLNPCEARILAFAPSGREAAQSVPAATACSRSNPLVQVIVLRELDAAHVDVAEQPLIRKVIHRDAVFKVHRRTGRGVARYRLGAAFEGPLSLEELVIRCLVLEENHQFVALAARGEADADRSHAHEHRLQAALALRNAFAARAADD